MRRIRIRMLASVDQLYAGTEYNLPEDMARDFASRGKAVIIGEEAPRALATFTVQVREPLETQVVKAISNAIRTGRRRSRNA